MIDTQAIAFDIKNALGSRGRDMIISDLGLKLYGDKVLCPLKDHTEETPSAAWYPDNSFHCFGCGGNYDIFQHYSDHWNNSFPEALKLLSKEAGIVIPEDALKYTPDPNALRINRNLSVGGYKNNAVSVENTGYGYYRSKKINSAIAKWYGCMTDASSIYFKSYEKTLEGWRELFSKIRKLDGSMYPKTEKRPKETKELCVEGAVYKPLFGIKTLFRKNDSRPPFCFITEGQTDCLTLMSAIFAAGAQDSYGCVSVATGSQSLKRSLEDSPTFMQYMKSDSCKGIILVPDADKAGMKMLEKAVYFMPEEKTTYLDLFTLPLPKQEGYNHVDISDVIIKKLANLSDLVRNHCEYLPDPTCLTSARVEAMHIEKGMSSGYATLDFNDSGLKLRKVMVLYGERGKGKTSTGRGMVLSVAMQGHSAFVYSGEASVGEEKDNYARCVAKDEDIVETFTDFGNSTFKSSDKALLDFDSGVGRNIIFYSPFEPDKNGVVRVIKNLFDDMMMKLIKFAKRGCKEFMVDNLMKLTEGAQNINREETRIVSGLVDFANKYNVHVTLIAHTNKTGEEISGSQNIENLVHTVVRFVRIDKTKSKVSKKKSKKGKLAPTMENLDMVEADYKKLTSTLIFEKVKDGGSDFNIMMEFLPRQGIGREVTFHGPAKEWSANPECVWSRPGVSAKEADRTNDAEGARNKKLPLHMQKKTEEPI